MDSLAELGFTRPEAELPRRLVISLSGLEKTGKTHLALTAEGTKVVFNLDWGLEGVAQKFEDVFMFNLDIDKPTYFQEQSDRAIQEAWNDSLSDTINRLEAAYRAEPGAIVIDTMTEFYLLERLARFGKVDQVSPQRYNTVNADMRAVVKMAYDARETTTIYINRMDEKYNKPGELEVKTWRELASKVQVNLETDRGPDGFRAVVRSARQNPEANGLILEGDQLNMEYIHWLIREWRH